MVKEKNNADQIEEEIFISIKNRIANISLNDARKIIREEIKKRKYLAEDWQIDYAVKRIEKRFNLTQEEKNNNSIANLLFYRPKLKMSPKELKYQIENYYSLTILKSARKWSGALIFFILFITFIVQAINQTVSILNVILLLLFAIFVYRGKKIAMVGMMIYWTFNRLYQLIIFFLNYKQYNLSSIIWVIFWWSIVIEALSNAYQVEKMRNK
jgi:predicted HTH domain antitoxin